MPYTKSKNAFALSIVLWIVAALLLGIAFVLNLSKESMSLTKGVQDKLNARLQAQNYLEVVKYYVMTANFDSFKLTNDVAIKTYKLPAEIILDGREYNLTKNITLSLQDASSMINLFYPNEQTIAALASQGDETLYYTIKDSIQDWIDTDNKVTLNGAESSYYTKEKDVMYHPRNYPALQSVDELRLIRGIDTLTQQQFDTLATYIYSSQHGAVIDLALLTPDYFSKLLHMDRETAASILNYKYNNFPKFVNLIRKNPYFDDSMGFGLSFNILIKIQVHLGDARVLLRTYIDFRKNRFRNTTTNIYTIY